MQKKNDEVKKTSGKIDVFREPDAQYVKTQLRFFNSFEEMNKADAMEMAATEGIEHLKNATALIKRIYKSELKRKRAYKIEYR